MTKWARIRYQPNLPLGENGQRVTACKEHILLSKNAAKEGMVLLKNDGTLPFKTRKIAVYGPGADEESYHAYAERSALATDYYNAYSENLDIDDAAIRAHEAENFDAYSSFAYANYTLSYSYFLTGGTEDENGNMVYTEEEKDAARAAAKAAAESLPQCSTVEELNAAKASIEKRCDENNIADREVTIDEERKSILLPACNRWL